VPAVKTTYLCQQCGAASPKWAGQCPSCSAWNTLVETVAAPRTATRAPSAARAMAGAAALTPIGEVSSAEASRLASGIGEVDRVLGGGFVPGSIILFGGDPGIGKSTLLLQLAARLAPTGGPVLYVTGEESAAQVRGRAERIGAVVDGLQLAATTDLETALAAIDNLSPSLAVVDSVQTLTSAELSGPAGSVGQVREVAARLAEAAKGGSTCVALVGHVTKEGTVAGPRTLEHLVDAVIYLEGERLGATRLLRAAKNRFGSTDEVGVLEMRGDGLVAVEDASRFFIESDEAPTAGTAITIALEGTRPLAVEIQALSAPAAYGSPATRDDRHRPQPRADAHRGPGPARRPQPVRPRRVRERRRRPAHRRTGVRPRGGGRTRFEPARAAGAGGHGAGRRGCAVRDACARPSGPSDACWKRLALGFDRLVTGPARGGRTDGARGLVVARDIREALQVRSPKADPNPVHGRAGSRVLRLRPSEAPSARSLQVHRSFISAACRGPDHLAHSSDPMTRIIQLTGALLGTLIGFATWARAARALRHAHRARRTGPRS
jgi:DNA repair protein RadA/Sms